MKTALLLLLFVLATSTTLFTQGLAADEGSTPQPDYVWVWPWFPWVRRSGPPSPPLPALSPDANNCLGSFITTTLKCLEDTLNSLLRNKPYIRPECCAAFRETHEDCLNNILDQNNNPFLAPLVKEHCFKQE